MDTLGLTLSPETSLVYVLRESGVLGRLTSGRVEKDGPGRVNVYHAHGALFNYLSGTALRSWCVVNIHGMPLPDWNAVLTEDIGRVVAYATGAAER